MIYLDSSALLKLILAEVESSALEAWLTGLNTDWVSSELAHTEVMRGIRRWAPRLEQVGDEVLAQTLLMPITTATHLTAAALRPPELRTLDAIHLSCALAVAEDLTHFVAYDKRLLGAARRAGLTTASPR